MMSLQGDSFSVASAVASTNVSPSCAHTPVKSVISESPLVPESGTVVPEALAQEGIPCASPPPSVPSITNPSCGRISQGLPELLSIALADASQLHHGAKGQPALEPQTRQQSVSQQVQQQSQTEQTVQNVVQQDQQQLQHNQILPAHQVTQQQQTQHLPASQLLHQNQLQTQQLQTNQPFQTNQQLQQNQLTQQLQTSSQVHQDQQPLSQSQQLNQNQLLHQGQPIQLGHHFQASMQLPQIHQIQPGQAQLQHALQLQQGQQLMPQLSQNGQHLVQQPNHQQQLVQQHQVDSLQQHHQQQLGQQQQQQLLLQSPQGQPFFHHQSLIQPQRQSILQQQTGQQQYQTGQRLLQPSTQHLMSQVNQQSLHQQPQLVSPLGQQQSLGLQQAGQLQQQQQLKSSLQSSGQQLFQPGQQALFQQQQLQQQPNQHLLSTQLLQSQASQQLVQQQPFPVNQQQLLQQQQTQQHLLQTQQLNSLQEQFVLQAIQGTGSRSLSIVPSVSSIGLVNTVPANVYRQIVSSVGTSSTTLVTQVSKNNSVSGSRGSVSQQTSLQRLATVQVVQPRQNTPLFIGQIGMVSNGTIIPFGQQGSGSVTVQSNGSQSQIMGSPTQIQLAAPLLGNPQALQVAMAQLQQQQQPVGLNSLTTQQPLFYQTGLSGSAQTDGANAAVTLSKSNASSMQPGIFNMSLPIQLSSIGPTGMMQGVPAKSASWPVNNATVADKNSFPVMQLETNQLKPITVPGSSSDLTQHYPMEALPMESVPMGILPADRRLHENAGQSYASSVGVDIHLGTALQEHAVTAGLGNRDILSTYSSNDTRRHDKSRGSLVAVEDTSSFEQPKVTATDGILSAALNTEKQTATVKPQILTHIIEGFVIQEGPEPFPVQRSSFMSEFLESTDEMTDSSYDGQSGDETTAEEKLKVTTTGSLNKKDLQEVERPLPPVAKEVLKFCTYCAKQYELPAFGRTGKFCSQTCAKRSAATSRWTMYHVNKGNEASASPIKKRSNLNGRGWIRANENRATTGFQQRHSQFLQGASVIKTSAENLAPVILKDTTLQMPSAHVARLNNTADASDETDFTFQQRIPPSQAPNLPKLDRSNAGGNQPLVTVRDSQGGGDSDPTHKHPSEWGVQDVYNFVKILPGCSSYADEFRLQEIDGQALLLLKEDHLMTTLNLKLGPALKICQQITALKDSFS